MASLKRAAEAFARKAKVGRTYYYIDEGFPPFLVDETWHTPLGEVEFQAPSRSSRLLGGNVPRWWGPHTAYDAYMKLGPLYENRNHRDIRGMRTSREWYKLIHARVDAFLGSDEFAASVEAAASGTAFRATWPKSKNAPKKTKKDKASR